MSELNRRSFLKGSLSSAAYVVLHADLNAAQSTTSAYTVVWDMAKAYREATPTRERICVNGLWQWQPAGIATDVVPRDGWGYLRVPERWPGGNARGPQFISPNASQDGLVFYPDAGWENQDLSGVTAAWQQREITIPQGWTGRRITLHVEYLNSYAVVYLDGTKVGEMRFPGGEVDLTAACRPGQKYLLSLLVVAMPLKAVMMSFGDSNAARQVAGQVQRKGICGDVYLSSTPAGTRITDVKVETSVRDWQITFDAALAALDGERSYVLRARILDGERQVREFTSHPFQANELANGRIRVTENWRPEKLWDTHTPQNQYHASLSLLDSRGKILDTALPVRFGFREFWIDGKYFYLNGTRIYLHAIPLNSAQGSATMASYEATRATLQRYKSFGINFVYTHNYGCEPGQHRTFQEVLTAADDEGVLLAFSQPHFGQYDWTAPDAETTNGYAQHAEFYVRVAQNHPAVVCYSTSHNACGYGEDMNPDMIDGILAPRDPREERNPARALRAEAIIRRLDSTRIVYHHAGNLGSLQAINFYGNWIPIQEMSDWFEHWATAGAKPVFTCEYSVPFVWDFTMYRGWYKGHREFGSAVAPWEFSLAEWAAQSLGARSYQITEAEQEILRWEAEQFRQGRAWRRAEYPHNFLGVLMGAFDGYPRAGSPGGETLAKIQSAEATNILYRVVAMNVTENYRAFRTWGNSATSSTWDTENYWLRPPVGRGRVDLNLEVDWEHLQRPGPRPAYVHEDEARELLAFHPSDYKPTLVADALNRNYRPLLAYIGGKPTAFTTKDHNFLAGEIVEKQLIVINNSREELTADCEWTFDTEQPTSGTVQVTVPPGDQRRLPLKLELPANLAPKPYTVEATVKFSSAEAQKDSFAIDVLPRPATPQGTGKVAVFDPKGETVKLLDGMGVHGEAVEANANVSAYDTLIIGKGALTLQGAAPNLGAVRDGLKVVIFEQTGEVLEKRLGFRIAEYGLRWVFKRVPDHPLLAGIEEEHLRNWRGESTTLPPRLNYEISPQLNGVPTVKWAGITVPRVWRRGNRGNVASALIEKPACGDFLPVLDGGYALQYTSLVEHRAGKGMVLFCQMDVNGRTESDPAAETLARNILQYAANWKPSAMRTVVYAGEPAGLTYLAATGVRSGTYGGGNLSAEQVLVVGPGGGEQLAAHAADLAGWVEAGGHVLALGLEEAEANAFLPMKVSMVTREHIAAFFEPFGTGSPLAGVSPAEVHNRDPRNLQLVAEGAMVVGDGVLATAANGNVVFCQLVPWRFDYFGGKMNVKRTYRKVSCLVARLLGNMQAAGETRLLEHVSTPVAENEKRWLDGLYLDTPEEWDDPYRFFRW
ncbi:MAG: glycoside hydrolase family 2 TIM barrel-domain containing protein [Terriglobia bacterium]